MDGGAFGEISLHSGSFVTAPAFDASMITEIGNKTLLTEVRKKHNC